MKINLLCSLLLCCLLAIPACKNEKPNAKPQTDNKPNSRFELTVRDLTGNALDSASVAVISPNGRQLVGQTNANGNIDIPNMTSGDTLEITKSGYFDNKILVGQITNMTKLVTGMKNRNFGSSYGAIAYGTVNSDSGSPLPNVTVTDTRMPGSAVTNNKGQYQIQTASPNPGSAALTFAGTFGTVTLSIIIPRDSTSVDVYISDVMPGGE